MRDKLKPPVCKKCGKKLEYKSKTFLCRKHYLRASVGDKASHWKGGRIVNDAGYIFILSLHHPYKDCKNYVREHRLIVEKSIGRYLRKNEIVHHINGIRDDNRLENLKVLLKKIHDKNNLKKYFFKNGHAPVLKGYKFGVSGS